MTRHKLQIDQTAPKPNPKWLPDKPRCLVAMRAGYSPGAIERAYGVPAHITMAWRKEAGIPRSTTPRPTPEVGQELV